MTVVALDFKTPYGISDSASATLAAPGSRGLAISRLDVTILLGKGEREERS